MPAYTQPDLPVKHTEDRVFRFYFSAFNAPEVIKRHYFSETVPTFIIFKHNEMAGFAAYIKAGKRSRLALF
ncbi:hypothetical protein DDR33_14190 [Pararcticibacter amylolyticus]|uniref:Uncharacterized protein n=1 Tax=Pararcticibacter amylolyticus TaxID=2173175 RepID=A0A2U2PEY2_9SPHI|nr:hypothetical protein DDR33_14190 [Pararcticibacter amylolyticus]